VRQTGSLAMAIAIAAVFRSSAHAEDAKPLAGRTAAPVEVVVTGTRTPESTQRATVRTDVVTREEAERRGATNVGEALQGQLGVEVNPSAYGFLGNPSAIQIQGFDLDRVLILQDGERVVGDVGGAIDLSQIPLTDVSRVEVVAGPMSSLYGASAIGGVVNILSAPPASQGLSGRARVEGRSRRGVLLQGNAAYRRGDAWAAMDASFQRQDGVLAREGAPDLAIPDFSSLLAGVRAGLRLGEHVTVQARGRWTREASSGRHDQVVPGLGSFRIDVPAKTDRLAVNLVETLELGGGSSVRFSAGRQWARDSSKQDRWGSPLDQTRERSDVMSSFESIATLANGPRTWVLGARAEAEQLDQEFTNTELVAGALRARSAVEVPQTTLGSGALYAQLAYKIHETLTVMPGARAELHLRYGGVVVPRLALAYRPTPRWILRLSGGRGFRAPSAKELGFSFDHSIYGYRVIGNPDLVPEKSWGLTGDVTFRPEPTITLRASVFANWVEELINLDLAPGGARAGVDDYTYQNIGVGRTFGGQINATYKAASWLSTEAGYAYLWTRDDTNERPLAGRPPHTISASAQVKLPLRLELVVRWRGVTDAFVDEHRRSPAFSTLDSRLARPLWQGALAYVGALNALDTRKDPDLSGDQRPIAGRTFYVGLTVEPPSETDP
jgi:outer membrane receptor for ferrienterochelin and colicins